jgi:hypothetical protein
VNIVKGIVVLVSGGDDDLIEGPADDHRVWGGPIEERHRPYRRIVTHFKSWLGHGQKSLKAMPQHKSAHAVADQMNGLAASLIFGECVHIIL